MFKDYSVTTWVLWVLVLVGWVAMGVFAVAMLLRPAICPDWEKTLRRFTRRKKPGKFLSQFS